MFSSSKWVGKSALVTLLFLFEAPLWAETDPVIEPENEGQGDVQGEGEIQGAVVEEESLGGMVMAEEGEEAPRRWSMDYFGIFYGPSLQKPNSYQPTPSGERDLSRPLELRNYLGASYRLSEAISVTPTLFWSWYPVHGHRLEMHDPFIRISHDRLIDTVSMNWYSDVRIHFPVTGPSRSRDLLAGVQMFHAWSWIVGDSPFTVSLYGSGRYNYFGKQGFGNDLELYIAPHVAYQALPNLAFTLLYEFGARHEFGQKAFQLEADGSDLEPGIRWHVTQSLMLNPYLNLYPAEGMSLRSTSVGFTVAWTIL